MRNDLSTGTKRGHKNHKSSPDKGLIHYSIIQTYPSVTLDDVLGKLDDFVINSFSFTVNEHSMFNMQCTFEIRKMYAVASQEQTTH